MNEETINTATDVVDRLNQGLQISLGWVLVLMLVSFFIGHRMARKAALKKYLKRWREEEPDT